jgi:hypothetical protein
MPKITTTPTQMSGDTLGYTISKYDFWRVQKFLGTPKNGNIFWQTF